MKLRGQVRSCTLKENREAYFNRKSKVGEKVAVPKEAKVKQPVTFGRRFSVKGVSGVSYKAMAYVSSEDREALRKAQKLDQEKVNPKEIEQFKKSTIYKRVRAALKKILYSGEDDFLTTRLELARYTGKGLGVKAQEAIKKGELICFYGGKIRRVIDETEQNRNHYLFNLMMPHWFIDGEKERSLGGMINHSHEFSNAEACIVEDLGMLPQVAICAKKLIRKGQEILLDYDEGREKGEVSVCNDWRIPGRSLV